MDKQALYKAIFTRRSVRKYKLTPLPGERLQALQKFLGEIQPLDPSILTLFAVVHQGEVSDPFRIRAPHYLCLYSENKGNYLMNAGYLLQQVDLYLSSQGLGSCWLGLARPSVQVPSIVDGLHFVIMLAFGEAEGLAHRSALTEFNRKSLSAITDIPEAEDILEPVRLAPSASNNQPWYITGRLSELVVLRRKPNLVQSMVYHHMNQIDIGIALCHLSLALEAQGKKADFAFQPEKVPSGFNWMAKVISE